MQLKVEHAGLKLKQNGIGRHHSHYNADHCEMNKECPTIYFSVYRRFKPRRKTGK